MLGRQPVGPFYLGGHSFGAMIAYEMALQLLTQGHDVGLLAIIDQHMPGQRRAPTAAIPGIYRLLTAAPGRIRYQLARVPAADRYGEFRRLVAGWSKTALGLKRDAASTFNLDRNETELISRFEAELKALRAYRPVPIPVPITLFRAKIPLMRHLPMDSTLGWKELAQREVHVRVVPGDHHSMTTEPLVRHLAQALSHELDLVQKPVTNARVADHKTGA
jgi:thioesterase domain-containing protein